jgi:hypothetical protein
MKDARRLEEEFVGGLLLSANGTASYTGKGLWVTCWAEAVEALAKKGAWSGMLSHARSNLEPPGMVADGCRRL